MLDRIRRIDDVSSRGSSLARKKASLTTAVTVEDNGEGDMKVRERWCVPSFVEPRPGRRAMVDPSVG